MQTPVVVTSHLLASLDLAIEAVEYALGHGRDEWSPEYTAHAEDSLSRLHEMRLALGTMRAEDERQRSEEEARVDSQREKEGKKPWML